MEALNGLSSSAHVQSLLESMLLHEKSDLEDEERLKLLRQAFAHIPFFSNLPEEVRETCCQEQFAVRQLIKPVDGQVSMLYKQGARLDGHSGLYVIIDGEVLLETCGSLHSHLHADNWHQQPHSLPSPLQGDIGVGPEMETARMRSGDAFGDEVLMMHEQDRSNTRKAVGEEEGGGCGGLTRFSSAVVPKMVFCIILNNPKVLHAIATFLKKQSSALYFLHPSLCLGALQKAAVTRSLIEKVRVMQCLDSVGLFDSSMSCNDKLEFASTCEFAVYQPGQQVFVEGSSIDSCCVVMFGKVLLCQDGAAPNAEWPGNQHAPHLGHIVDELTSTDVLIDPAPWYHGVWPCSAVVSIRTSVIIIPVETYEKLRSVHAAFTPRQFVRLLSKPCSTRTRLENQRVAQFLSVFPSINGVAMDKRVELAQMITLDTYQPGQILTCCENQELIVLSGAARELDEDGMTSRRQVRHDEDGMTRNADMMQCGRLCMVEDIDRDAGLVACLHDLVAYLHKLGHVQDQPSTYSSSRFEVDQIAHFVSVFEAMLFARSCEHLTFSSTGSDDTHGPSALERIPNRKAGRPAGMVGPGDVIGRHVFPSRTRKDSRYSITTPMAVAVLSCSNVEGPDAVPIFRQGSFVIHPQWQLKLIEALRLPPLDRSPDHVENTVMGLQNIPILSFLRHPDVFQEVCAQMTLLELQPGARICAEGQSVECIFIVLQGTVESFVSAKEAGSSSAEWRSKLRRGSQKIQAVNVIRRTSISDSRRPPRSLSHSNHAPMYEDSYWSRSTRPEVTAVFGPGDSVGFANMLNGTWLESLRASHQGCSLAVVPSRMLNPYSNLLFSCISLTVTAAGCSSMLHVPRMFLTAAQGMTLRMLLSRTPAFMGLSEKCVAKLCERVFHKHFGASQLVYAEGDDSDFYALVVKGSLGSYRGLQSAVKSLLNPHVGGYVSPHQSHPLQKLAPASITAKLFRLVPDHECYDDDDNLEDPALWDEYEFDLDRDGNLVHSTRHSRLTVGSITQELTDLNAPTAILEQCRLKISGITREEILNSKVKLGHAKHRLRLKFGATALTVWSADSEVMCTFLLCVVRHWISGKDHPLGMLVKTIGVEGEVGTGVLQAGAAGRQEERSSAAGSKSVATSNAAPKGAQKQPAAVPKGTEMQPNHRDFTSEKPSEAAKNSSSLVALEPAELLMVRRCDVEEVMLELRTEELLDALKSLGGQGAALVKETEQLYPHIIMQIGACLELCRFEPTRFLFHAGKSADRLFLISKGHCSLLYPVEAKLTEEMELSGRRRPAIRSHRKGERLIHVMHVQSPCFLGLHNNSNNQRGKHTGIQNSEQITKGMLGQCRAVYGMSAQANTAVEAYVLKMSTIETASPELKTRFFDRLLRCMEEQVLVHQQGLSKMQVAHQPDFLSHQSDVQKRTKCCQDHPHMHAPVPTGSETEIRRKIRSNDPGARVGRFLQGEIQAAAAALSFDDLSRCRQLGLTQKTYRACRACPMCMRETYPKEAISCKHCGHQIGIPRMFKFNGMDKDAESTLENLLSKRYQSRRFKQKLSSSNRTSDIDLNDELSSFKSSMQCEQIASDYATVMSEPAFLLKALFEVTGTQAPKAQDLDLAPQMRNDQDMSKDPHEKLLNGSEMCRGSDGHVLDRQLQDDACNLNDIPQQDQEDVPRGSPHTVSAFPILDDQDQCELERLGTDPHYITTLLQEISPESNYANSVLSASLPSSEASAVPILPLSAGKDTDSRTAGSQVYSPPLDRWQG